MNAYLTCLEKELYLWIITLVYKKKFYNEIDETEGFDINENEMQNEKIEFQSNNDNYSEPRSQDDDKIDEEDKRSLNLGILSGLIKSINYSRNYLKMKESVKNEKYLILFTDLFNYFRISEEEIERKFENMQRDKELHFLLVGKNKMRNIKNEKEKEYSSDEDDEKRMKEIINEKFGNQSEIIDFENMKKIKTILSSNNVIKDEIIYPNEIYK